MSRQSIQLERLKSSRDFQEIYRSGSKYPGQFFILFIRSRSDRSVFLGVTATRRIGCAVIRNRAKRLMREAARQVLPGLEFGCDMVLVARSQIRSAVMQQVKDQLMQNIARFRRIKTGSGSISV